MEKRCGNKPWKIVITGPESTGKSHLARYLSVEYKTVFVPEYARDYISNLNGRYTYKDVETIALKQIELEMGLLPVANNIIFYDTYLIITKIWFQVVFNKIPDWIDVAIKDSNIDLFILCNTDIPWESDPVRENGGAMRDELLRKYETELINYGFDYKILSGLGEMRYTNAIKIVNKFLNNNN